MDHEPNNSRTTVSLGALLRGERERRGLSRGELAAAVRRVDRTLQTSVVQVRRWELGLHEPLPVALRALAQVFGLELLARRGSSEPAVDPDEPVDAEPVGAEYVEAITKTITSLVALEVQHGSDEAAVLAQRYFRSVRRRLAVGARSPALTVDFIRAAGELAEVTSWLLHDADHQDAARQLGMEALYLLRLVGDRSTELLTMSNLGYMALFNRRPHEGLLLARSALERGELSGRQQVMFELREARGQAQLGARAEAVRQAERALAGFLEGTTIHDPLWAWWVDVAEVQSHVAAIYGEVQEFGKALELRQAAVDAGVLQGPNNYLSRLVQLFDAALEAGAWEDAERALESIRPYVTEVRSGRVRRVLHRSLAGTEAKGAPPRLVEAGGQLKEVLAE